MNECELSEPSVGDVSRSTLKAQTVYPGSDFALTPWDGFVLSHARPLNLLVHLSSTLILLVGSTLAFVTQNGTYWLSLVISAALCAYGRWLRGDGGPNIRALPAEMLSTLYLPVALGKVLSGSYFTRDLARARARSRQQHLNN